MELHDECGECCHGWSLHHDLRTLRINEGLSIAALANMAGVTELEIEVYERHGPYDSARVEDAILIALGVETHPPLTPPARPTPPAQSDTAPAPPPSGRT